MGILGAEIENENCFVMGGKGIFHGFGAGTGREGGVVRSRVPL